MIFRLLSHQQQRGTMIDVGAHVGTALAPFASAGWQVVAFEPDSVNRRNLEESFRSFPNVSIDPRALADEPRKAATLFRSDVSTGISSLTPFHPSHVAADTTEVTTLEQVSEDRSIQSLDFLKIDTEGYDLPVLKGLPWRTLKPRVILCEFEDTKTLPLGYSFRDLADFLQERGYKLIVSEWYPVKRYGGRHQWRRFALYPCQLVDPRCWGNIIGTDSDLLHHADAANLSAIWTGRRELMTRIRSEECVEIALWKDIALAARRRVDDATAVALKSLSGQSVRQLGSVQVRQLPFDTLRKIVRMTVAVVPLGLSDLGLVRDPLFDEAVIESDQDDCLESHEIGQLE